MPMLSARSKHVKQLCLKVCWLVHAALDLKQYQVGLHVGQHVVDVTSIHTHCVQPVSERRIVDVLRPPHSRSLCRSAHRSSRPTSMLLLRTSLLLCALAVVA